MKVKIAALICTLFSGYVVATETAVGSRVSPMANSLSMILSLLLVLVVIVVAAMLLKRFNLVQPISSDLKVVASLPLSAKERILVVQVGEKQVLLGVTAQQITHLGDLEQPITKSAAEPPDFAQQLKKFMKKSP